MSDEVCRYPEVKSGPALPEGASRGCWSALQTVN